MTKDYECHITVDVKENVREFLESVGNDEGWKTSFVVGDPDLGNGSRFFFTRHYSELEVAKIGTNILADLLHRFYDIEVARKKIELVVMDTKAGTWK